MLRQSELKSYTILEQVHLEELNAEGFIMEHNRTKAKVVVISNDDENKVFTIGFRTPPTDDTGVPHIMEHSVLCGSKKYPAKDPFVELAKGSLNTFLNAMTYSDKTVYPIASCNEKDFENLMDVYLDAVFHPNIYSRPEIMKQEGWHYDIQSLDGELCYNGVVFNEMKGVFSSPEQQLYREIQKSLLPDTTYGCESGGDPEAIPDLTQEQFLDFHRTYYHPSNSYIYLYGNLDMAKELNYIDEAYLSEYDYKEINSEIQEQEAFCDVQKIEKEYSVSENDDLDNKTYLSYNMVVGNSLDREAYLAFQILDYVLIDMPGAPLKTAMIDAGIGMDFVSSYDNGIKQPIYSLVSKGTNPEDEERFIQVLEAAIGDIVDNGLDMRSIEAAMNHFEFKYKEANFGSYPKGLMYGLKLFDSWLYDETKPFIHIQTNEVFKLLKSKLRDGYFESLLKTYILDNSHKSIVVLKPKKGLNQALEMATKKKLQAYKDGCSKEQLEQMIADKKALVEYQTTPSTKEELESLPLLNLSDISKDAKKLVNQEYKVDDVPVIGHKIFTNDIAYVSMYFKMDDIDESLFPYAALLSDVFKYVDTDNYSYRELSNEINIHTGGVAFDVTGVHRDKAGNYTPLFMAKFKTFYDKLDKGFAIVEEILFHSHITDEKRLKEIVAESRIGMKETLASAGHNTAAQRAQAYLHYSAKYKELTDGIAYYEFLVDLEKNFDSKKQELMNMLTLVTKKVFRKEALIISYTGEQDVEKEFSAVLPTFTNNLSSEPIADVMSREVYNKLNEGFQIASKVQYVATAGNFMEQGYAYTAALEVLKVIFSYDYLWIRVRVTGGAYGCMCSFQRNGMGYFTSYRDPKLMETYEVYKEAPAYLESFDADERDMTKYIIGAVAKLDNPMTPSTYGAFSFVAYMSGITEEDLQKERDEILGATVETIRGLAPIVRAVTDSDVICVVGAEDKLKENKDHFGEIRNVF